MAVKQRVMRRLALVFSGSASILCTRISAIEVAKKPPLPTPLILQKNMTARIIGRAVAAALLHAPLLSSAQLFIGSAGNDLYLSPGSSIMYERMKITAPAGGLSLTNTEVTENPQAIGSVSGPSSILRTYSFHPGVALSGVVDVFYHDAELNGNNESLLELAYGASGAWQTTSGSSVDAVANIVSNTLTAVTVTNVTAVEGGVALSLAESGFSARLTAEGVTASWKVSGNEKYRRFEVQRSGNAHEWARATDVQARATGGVQSYSALDADAAFKTRYYRLKVTSADGGVAYSPVVLLTNNAQPSMQVASRDGGFHIRFDDWSPASAILMDAQGRTLRTALVAAEWEERGLAPGIYLIKLTDGTTTTVQRIAVR